MGKIRVHELAKELNVESKKMVDYLQKQGCNIKNHMSIMDEKAEDLARRYFGKADAVPGFRPTVKRIKKEVVEAERALREQQLADEVAKQETPAAQDVVAPKPAEQKQTVEKTVQPPLEKTTEPKEKAKAQVKQEPQPVKVEAKPSAPVAVASDSAPKEIEKPVVSAAPSVETKPAKQTNEQVSVRPQSEQKQQVKEARRDNRENRDNNKGNASKDNSRIIGINVADLISRPFGMDVIKIVMPGIIVRASVLMASIRSRALTRSAQSPAIERRSFIRRPTQPPNRTVAGQIKNVVAKPLMSRILVRSA